MKEESYIVFCNLISKLISNAINLEMHNHQLLVEKIGLGKENSRLILNQK